MANDERMFWINTTGSIMEFGTAVGIVLCPCDKYIVGGPDLWNGIVY